ncbi:DUF1641 domain-containing protein [Aquibacillus sp. 3ASR75-11]|uniref:DUF1641 domain-containing protein n=1 Tax=Terrihalobacillus insolitus TaxID=2950438 RepID=A0A9X4ALV5_9BACI|nr:DUF1641 domain-containing protein [Terrihalobacillus insolitus]MDC3414723.1 DUF1641 domain-containing protein [Terrihalobacillus insolitus]MDC3424164.1 DUF1641 domain-containing protein [Terrihalobacillus insolitus]
MAKATTQIEKKESNVEEERAEDIAAIMKQIADNREAIQDSLIILQELHQSGVLDMVKGLLRTREKVGVLAMEQINQPGMHNIMRNGMNSIELLASLDPDQLKTVFGGLTQGLQKASESIETNEQMGAWGMLKSMRDPNVKTSLNTMAHFLNGMGEGLNNKKTH